MDTLPPCLSRCVSLPQADEDDPPPVIGERYRDTLHDIYRAAAEAALEQEDTAP